MNPSASSISSLLRPLASESGFATRFSLDADPQLSIEGVGSIALPVSAHTAHRICAIAQPAMHGFKSETRLDRAVRDTWEIPAASLSFGSADWQNTLAQALQRIRHDLRLPAGCQLDAQLHNLLVYAPGQFFSPHQDSEKVDGMLGSLVVTLPSAFTGGEFIVSHQGQKIRTRSSTSKLGLVAFYADCQHEVRPVKQGYRVVLTYNLIAHGSLPTATAPEKTIAVLSEAVDKFLSPPSLPRGGQRPNRLVYLLDHQYTPRSLSWSHLKGADATRCAALRQAARQLGLEVFLALAEAHESWTAYADNDTDNRWGYEDDEDADNEHETNADNPEPQELIDREIQLHHWIAVEGEESLSGDTLVDDIELCFTRSNTDCTPYESEYEGYMGNYGNTLDRWYHRAALVMWPRERNFIIRAGQSPAWALVQISARLAAGDRACALQWTKDLEPFWKRAALSNPEILQVVLPLAVEIDDAETARMLLSPFVLERFQADMANGLLALAERYSTECCLEGLSHQDGYLRIDSQLQWLEQTYPQLIRTWQGVTDSTGPVLARALVEERWVWLQSHIGACQTNTVVNSRTQRLKETTAALLAMIQSSATTGLAKIREEAIAVLMSPSTPLPVSIDALHKVIASKVDCAPFMRIHEHCIKVLSEHLRQAERAAGDWSIILEGIRAHEPERTFDVFLRDAARQRFEWPLAKQGRQTIHNLIDEHQLPVLHQTRRVGSPYTLVLQKTAALFEREAAQRQTWSAELAWLHESARHFSVDRGTDSHTGQVIHNHQL